MYVNKLTIYDKITNLLHILPAPQKHSVSALDPPTILIRNVT